MTLLSFPLLKVGRVSRAVLVVLVMLIGAVDSNAIFLIPSVTEYSSQSFGRLDCSPCTTLDVQDSDAFQPVRASTRVLEVGTSPQDWRVRTAGRASSTEIAANALFEERALQQVSISHPFGSAGRVDSSASIALDATMIATVRSEVFLDFTIPSGFVEFRDNLETGPLNMGDTFPVSGAPGIGASIFAQIRSCPPGVPNCVFGGDPQFQLRADISGNYNGHALDASAFGLGLNSGLDTSALLANSVSVQHLPGQFEQLYHWDHPAFTGRLSLGIFDPGDTVRVEYFMSASLVGLGWGNYAAAAINDPFALDIDPVQATPFSLEAIAVPEPSTFALLAAGVWARWRRSVRRSRTATRGPVA